MWLRFTPSGGSQTSMVNNTAGNYQWDVFRFDVTGYYPTFPWYMQMSMGANYDTFGPLDMSLCYCANCDAGYSTRIISTCDMGYATSTGDYNLDTTNRSPSVFNENKVLYSFDIDDTLLMLFYSDEHALLLGEYLVYFPNGSSITYSITARPESPTCVYTPNIEFGSPYLDGSNITGNVDTNSDSNGCISSLSSGSNYVGTCGRPVPPVLFITDISTDSSSMQGDWQFGGTPILPHKICGLWKGATKTITSTTPVDDSYSFTIAVESNPVSNRNTAQNGWNLGVGSDPPPVGATNPSSTPVSDPPIIDYYGTEVAWNLSLLNLIDYKSYRFQIMVHDGDQTRSGGDVGQGCINVGPACPAGFTGSLCDTCDKAPGDGSYTWYCIPSSTGSSLYSLIKIPTADVTTKYANSGGFIPGNGNKDSDGYLINCDCSRVIYTCPDNCCGNGVCAAQTGTCTCTDLDSNETTCCIFPQTPTPVASPTPTPIVGTCYNGGIYCSGNGICTNGVCNCSTNYYGTACQYQNVTIKKKTCAELNLTSCSDCITISAILGVTCIWCSDSNSADTTTGSCLSNITCSSNYTSKSTCYTKSVVYVPPPCPDDCLGHGKCENVSSGNGTSNYTEVCVCDEGYFGVNCGGTSNSVSSTVIAAASLSAGLIVAIVIVAALCAGGGGGAYAYSQMNDAGADVNIQNNPIYAHNTNAHSNPLNRL